MGEKIAGMSEDWLSVCLGFLVFVLSLATLVGTDLLGWVVSTSVWVDLSKALAPASKGYAALGGTGALIATYVALLVALTVGAALMNANVKRFALGFTAVFWLSYVSWIIGSWANIAATTPAQFKTFGISWSLRLTPEAGFIVALLAGLAVGNFMPKFAAWMQDAVRPELYIKTAIVILGGFLGLTAAQQLSFATTLMFRGLAAIIEAYLIYWAVVYYVARKYFKFSREWAAPLASGISICGVSAAIATGGAIRARPVVPVLVSSLVVIFAVVEVLILPLLAETFLSHEPLVAGAWLGLAVKTDGAALAAGGITDALILARAASEGVNYQPGWILGTTATVKVFIDIFIGVWTFILGYIWTNHIDRLPGSARARPIEIWQRFPKFIVGFLLTFVVGLAIALSIGAASAPRFTAAVAESNVFRVIFFILTFFSIGVLSNFRRLWEQGLGKLAAVYFVSLFGFVIWVGLLISWLFFAGVKPPLAS